MLSKSSSYIFLYPLYRYKFKNYQFVLALVFAIEEINRNPHLLPNTSLGFDLHNIPFSEKNTLMNAFIWLTGVNGDIVNYNCKLEQKSAAALTGTSFAISAHMGTLLQLYKIPQLTFGPFDSILGDRAQFTSLYQMAPKDTYLPRGIVSLMLHFKWSWVGLLLTDDHRGMQILSDLKEEMKKNRVCVAFVELISDMDHCVKCPESHYANTERNHCLQKTVTFLHFEDPLGMALSSTALCFSAITATVLGIFVKHRDTPIVKANNRALSYILLITLIICFLYSLLFIGQPNTATCILQQTTFGIVFTVALSTVLAKALTVVIAFKVTFPGKWMRWLMISRATNYIIPIFTLLQIILCGIWLGTSPPFVDQDSHAQHGHIIILCNKGSAIAFHCVLGYLCSLAIGSYIMAFLSRNLPDKFNEAKFLTFSMLVFFSVWVTFLPVYHSTKGTIMVAMEIFSILSSSAALLGFIFAPKCYIIFLKPDKNVLHGIRDNSHRGRNYLN
uniref:G-protein coupled receptors family 3 profile domain-containing protein n=1 Tax=Cricetulus griseus TaxID=10029 RepID=A0A8C2LN25_CRIGR